MFLKKKQMAWYWKACGILFFLRILYSFARFFMKVVEGHAAQGQKRDSRA